MIKQLVVWEMRWELDGEYVINLDDYKTIGSYWWAIFVKNDVAINDVVKNDTFIALGLNIFQKKSKISYEIKIS